MKKIITTIAILFVTLSIFSQSNKAKYFQKMGQTLGEYASCNSIEDYNKLSNKFIQISNVEKQEWLPLYYAAHCKIIMSFMEHEDKIKKDAYLDVAEKMINQMLEIDSANPEIFTLQAFMYTARLVVDPMTRGQEYSMKATATAQKALAFNKTNPRALYIILSNKIGFAKFFGKEIVEECKEANELFSKWDEYNASENPLAPKWGKTQVEEIVNECK